MAVRRFDVRTSEREPELEYLPSRPDVTDPVRTTKARRVPLAGIGGILDLAAEDVRTACLPGSTAAKGAYLFRTDRRQLKDAAADRRVEGGRKDRTGPRWLGAAGTFWRPDDMMGA